jgi:hypothetical protein
VVLVDEAADAVAAVDRARAGWILFTVASWWQQVEGAVRPLGVVVVDEDAQHLLEVAAIENQQPVETFGADGADEPLGDRVRLRRPHRRLDDPDAFAAEDLVEGAAVLAVAVANQEADALVGEVEAEVPRLLGHPLAARIGCAAREPDAAALVSDEEEHKEAPQENRLDREEIAGDDARRPEPAGTRANSDRRAAAPAQACEQTPDAGR